MKRTAEEIGDDDYLHVSSHDLRRRFAQRLLVDRQMNPRVVMQVAVGDYFETEATLQTPDGDDIGMVDLTATFCGDGR